MHMADALLSPQVGGVMWAASGAAMAYSTKKVKDSLDDKKVPLMGVLGAFIFAAQMINFTIPGTGSSGHLGGGMILAVLLGPYAAFLVMSSVLTVQALFFADGGLLALGCNMFNLGFFPAFIAYPLIYKPIAGFARSKGRITGGSIASVLVGLQLGAFFVVLETVFSGISELPFKSFLLMMQPIHLAIGLVEGLVTAAVLNFIYKTEPMLLDGGSAPREMSGFKKIITVLVIFSVITGGVLSWFASKNPDGLEWSMFKVSGKEELKNPEGTVHSFLEELQGKFSFLPDYGFKTEKKGDEKEKEADKKEEPHPTVDGGRSLAGLLGGLITIVIIFIIGFIIKKKNKSSNFQNEIKFMN